MCHLCVILTHCVNDTQVASVGCFVRQKNKFLMMTCVFMRNNYRALQLITKNVYHKKPARLPLTHWQRPCIHILQKYDIMYQVMYQLFPLLACVNVARYKTHAGTWFNKWTGVENYCDTHVA